MPLPSRFLAALRGGLLLLLAGHAAAAAGLRLPGLFSDHAVLQADQPIRVWGWADPGELVTVSLGDTRQSATVDEVGRWSVQLPAREASFVPQQLTVATVGKTIVRSDILMGDVWLCSGQSNMENRLSITTDGAAHVAAANVPGLRLFRVPRLLSAQPVDDIEAAWAPSTPQSAAAFSAIGYHFGRGLRQDQNRPIGLIHSAHGATAVEAWISAPALAGDPGAATVFTRTPSVEARYPSYAWNGLAAPLAGFTLRGVLWYQGETNAHWGTPPEYSQTLPLLIRSWRAAWKQPDLPFFVVQLPNYQHTGANGLEWARLREQQLAALSLPATGLVVALDLGESTDIHPLEKTAVARRLQLLAMAHLADPTVREQGPRYASHSFAGNVARVQFALDAGTTLTLRTGLSGFELAGADRVFQPATASLDGTAVVLQAAAVPAPVAVRYGYRNDPPVSLFDSAGLPAAPFRTDLWDSVGPRLVAQPKAVTATVGARVELSAAAVGTNLSYQWQRAGTPIQGATGPTLTLAAVTAADAGELRLRVTDGTFTVFSVPARLTVLAAGETLLLDPSAPGDTAWTIRATEGTVDTVAAGSNTLARLSATGSSGYPSLHLEAPDGRADLSAAREVRFAVTNLGTATATFTAWALSGPGWGGAPATGQIGPGRLTLAAGATTEVVIDLGARYPGPALPAAAVDATRVTALKLILQPGSGLRLGVGPIRLAGGPTPAAASPERGVLAAVEAGPPAAGRRVLRQLPGYAGTGLSHVVGLPAGWTPGALHPVLVEYPGNVFYHLYCHSSGWTRDANFGASLALGTDFIVLQLPLLNTAGTAEERNGWGSPDATLAYALAAVEDAIENLGADSNLLLLGGFSRGAYAADYLGLRSAAFADLWHGFVLSQGHATGTGGWNGSATGFAERQPRLLDRPVFLSRATWEGATRTTSADPGLGSNVHADVGFLEPSAALTAWHAWAQNVRTARPATRSLTGRVLGPDGQPRPGLTVRSGLHRAVTRADGTFTIPGLVGPTRPVVLGSGAANPAAGFSVAATGDAYAAGDLTTPFLVTQAPLPLTVGADDDALFTVAVTAGVPVTYAWRHGANALSGATTASLLLSRVTPAQAGTYTVRITGPSGAVAEVQTTLTVTAPIDILVPPTAPTLITTADGMIHDRFPTTNHNSSPLQVSSRGVPWNRKVYLRFVLPVSAVPAGREVAAAELRLQIVTTGSILIGSAVGRVPLSIHGLTNPNATWDEATLTWDNAPANLKTSGASFLPDQSTWLATTEVDSTTVTAGAWVTFRSPALAAFLNSMREQRDATGGNEREITLMLHAGGATTDPGFSFSRRESTGASRPAELAYVLRAPASGPSLSTWRQGWFGQGEDHGVAANLADPDGDGVPNLLEYALGTSPNERAWPFEGLAGGLVFPHPPSLPEVSLSVEASFDLASWRIIAYAGAGQDLELLDPGYTLTALPDRPGWLHLAPTLDPLPDSLFHRLRADSAVW